MEYGFKKIPNRFFQDCELLEMVNLTDEIEAIGSNAFKNCHNLTIYSTMNPAVIVYAIDNRIRIKVTDTSEAYVNSMFDFNNTYYYADLEHISSDGYLKCTVEYKVKEEYEGKIRGRNLIVRMPDNAELMEETIRLDGVLCQNFSYEDMKLRVPVTSDHGKLEFSIYLSSAEEIASYAQMSFTKDNVSCNEVIGILMNEVINLTLNTSEKIAQKEIVFHGMAPKNAEVEIYLNGELIKTILSTKAGNYMGNIEIDPESDYEVYKLKAVVNTEEKVYTAEKKIVYEAQTPILKDLTLYYDNHSATKIALLPNGTKTPYISFNPNVPFTFVADFENNENIENVYIVSERNNIKKLMPAEYDESSGTYIATGYFDENNHSYVPGAISVEYSEKREVAKVGQEVDWEELYNGIDDRLKDCEVSIKQGEEGEQIFTIDFSTLYDTFGDTSMDLSIKALDHMSGAELSEYLSMFEQNSKYLSYIIPGIDDERYQAYLNYTDPETISMVIYDASSLVKNAVEFQMNFNCDTSAIKDWMELTDKLDTFNTVAGVVYEGIGIYMETEELKDEILASETILNKPEALRKAEELGNDRMMFMLLTTALPLLIAPAAGVMAGPALVFTGMLAIISASSSLFWDLRIANIKGEKTKASWIIDPSGYVYEAVTSNRLENVVATAYFKEKLTDANAILWDASEYGQENPLYTDSLGWYAWDVPEGYWQVKYEAEGYQTAYSEWMEVPPPQTDVNVGLISTENPEIAYVNVFEEFVEIEFDQYMVPESVGNVKIENMNGDVLPYELIYSQDETAADGTVYAKYYQLRFETPIENNDRVRVVYEDDVLNYVGKKLEKGSKECLCVVEPVLIMSDSISLKKGMNLNIPFRIENYQAQNIECLSEFDDIAKVQKVHVEADGKGYVTLCANMYGQTNINLTVQGTCISKKISINVGKEVSGLGSLTYYDGEMAMDLQPEFYLEGMETELPIPVKEGSVFEGWYLNADFSGGILTKISAEMTGNIVLYAAWKTGMQYEEYLVEYIPEQTYTASAIKPKPIVRDGDVLLLEGTDYTLSYKNNIKVGTAQVIVKGKGNYTKTMNIEFEIVPKNLADGDVLVSCADKLYNGKKQVSKPTVKWGKITLKSGTDYTVTYSEDQISAGVVSVVIEGKGNYCGTAEHSYRITDKDISKVILSKMETQYYNGEELKPEIILYADKNAQKAGEALIVDTDYSLVYENNVNAGKGTVRIIGLGRYGGTKTVTFTINKRAVASESILVADLSGENINEYYAVYNGIAHKPKVCITDQGKIMEEGKDYKLSYANTTNAATIDSKSKPTITVTGIGNYTGSVKTHFNILAQDISEAEGLVVSVEDAKYTGKQVKPKVTITYAGKTLKSGTDYKITGYYNNIECSERDGENAPYVSIEGIKNFSGNIDVRFRVYQFVASSFVVDKIPTQIYTPHEMIRPEIRVYADKKMQSAGNLLTEGIDYEIVFYASNEKAGTGKVTICGLGQYGGIKTVTYTIAKRNLSTEGIEVQMSNDKMIYNGNALKPEFKVWDGNLELTEGADYTVSFANNKTVPTGSKTVPAVTIKGINNYTGTIKTSFEILPKDLADEGITVMAKDVLFNQKTANSAKGMTTTVTVMDGSKKISTSGYKIVEYKNNRVATGGENGVISTVVVEGCGNYKGTVEIPFRIYENDISKATVAKISNELYTGSKIEPNPIVTIKLNKTAVITLVEGKDYTVSYDKNIKIGKADVIITGLGEYGGIKKVTFTIIPKWLKWFIN